MLRKLEVFLNWNLAKTNMQKVKWEKQLKQLIQEKLIKQDKLEKGSGGRNYFIVVIKHPPILIGAAIYKTELHKVEREIYQTTKYEIRRMKSECFFFEFN